jgi:glyoxylase-like metal-dependent hydrolase (beta-lactamase superfamily II)
VDERQYVPRSGQRWTTLDALRADHAAEVREEGGLLAIGTSPRFAIGQRALLVPADGGNVLWDCVTVLDDAAAAAVEARGGLAAIAISHPHYYSAMVEWARRFDCPVVLHAADERWIMRPDPALELWDGEERDLCGLRLLRLGGHFAGGTVAIWPEGAGGAGALLAGDIVQVLPDPHHVGFMYSYPNYIPLPGATVTEIAARLARERFDAIYGAFWDGVIPRDGQGIVRRSAERYVRALSEVLG